MPCKHAHKCKACKRCIRLTLQADEQSAIYCIPTLQDYVTSVVVSSVLAESCVVTVVQPRVSAPSLGLSSLAAAAASAAPIAPPDGGGPPVLAPPPRAGALHAPLLAVFSAICPKDKFAGC